MGKYSPRNKPDAPRTNREIHPVMRGIGCIMVVIVPIISWFTSVLLANQFAYMLPKEISTPIKFPKWVWALNGLESVFRYIEDRPLIVTYIVFTILLTIFIFTIMSIIYGFIYKAFGPSQYGPTDEPPIRKKVKRYTR